LPAWEAVELVQILGGPALEIAQLSAMPFEIGPNGATSEAVIPQSSTRLIDWLRFRNQ
jgi:hypothetical protein